MLERSDRCQTDIRLDIDLFCVREVKCEIDVSLDIYSVVREVTCETDVSLDTYLLCERGQNIDRCSVRDVRYQTAVSFYVHVCSVIDVKT